MSPRQPNFTKSCPSLMRCYWWRAGHFDKCLAPAECDSSKVWAFFEVKIASQIRLTRFFMTTVRGTPSHSLVYIKLIIDLTVQPTDHPRPGPSQTQLTKHKPCWPSPQGPRGQASQAKPTPRLKLGYFLLVTGVAVVRSLCCASTCMHGMHFHLTRPLLHASCDSKAIYT